MFNLKSKPQNPNPKIQALNFFAVLHHNFLLFFPWNLELGIWNLHSECNKIFQLRFKNITGLPDLQPDKSIRFNLSRRSSVENINSFFC
jgi:hypothetical protein